MPIFTGAEELKKEKDKTEAKLLQECKLVERGDKECQDSMIQTLRDELQFLKFLVWVAETYKDELYVVYTRRKGFPTTTSVNGINGKKTGITISELKEGYWEYVLNNATSAGAELEAR